MTILHSLILGIVEGLTEFLPISSTFHLIATSRWLSLANNDFLSTFEVVIQGGAILALLTIYLRTLLTNRTLSSRVLLSFLPTAVVGFVLYSFIKSYFFAATWLSWVIFVLVGLLFLLTESWVSSGRLNLRHSLESLTNAQALLIGLAQSLAVIPGVSRAGSVIVAMMFLGYRRDEAARYTFLLSLPTILAASSLDLLRSRSLFSQPNETFLLALGFVTSFVVAYFVVKWFLHYLSSHTLRLFAWYRFILAGIILATLGF